MPVYSHLFFSGGLTTTASVFITVPVGQVAVIRDVEARNTGGAPDDLVIGWSGVPGFAGYFFPLSKVPAAESLQWQGRVCLPAGMVVQAAANFGSFEATISGYLLG